MMQPGKISTLSLVRALVEAEMDYKPLMRYIEDKQFLLPLGEELLGLMFTEYQFTWQPGSELDMDADARAIVVVAYPHLCIGIGLDSRQFQTPEEVTEYLHSWVREWMFIPVDGIVLGMFIRENSVEL